MEIIIPAARATLKKTARPGVQIILDSLRRKAEAAQAPGYRGTEVLDRKTTFVDLLMAKTRGLDVRQRDAFDEWQERIGDEEIADLLASMDEEPAKSYGGLQPGDYISKGVNVSLAIRRGVAEALR